jgi:hypothetical protein
MSGRLQAYLNACLFVLLALVASNAALGTGMAGDVLGAGGVTLVHLHVWARASSLALATRSELAASALGARPLVGIPLFFVIVLAFGPIPAAFAGGMVAGGAFLLGLGDALRRDDVLRVLAQRDALAAEARC